MRVINLLPFFLFCHLLSAQQHDNFWITGYKLNNPWPDGNIIRFDSGYATVTPQKVLFTTSTCQGTMSDAQGNLLYYTNGIKLANADHELIENGDSLNWGYFANILYNTEYKWFWSILNLPDFKPGEYIMLHQRVVTDPVYSIRSPDLLYTRINMSANNGKGKVLAKNQFYHQGFYYANMSAIRHGNGRDWWILGMEYLKNKYFRVRYSPDGFSDSLTAIIGTKPPSILNGTVLWDSIDGGGQKLFSPDGKKYIDFDSWNGLRIMDFDRCTGLLSNWQLIKFPFKLQWGSGAAISPNSRFLYITTAGEVLQYDLQAPDIAASMDTVAVWDGFYSPWPPFSTKFGPMQLMPDGRIYIVSLSGVYHVSYINYPDLKGDSCMVVQHGLNVPNVITETPPIFPNYRLYDWQGSPCDTLGIDGPVSAVTLPPFIQESEQIQVYPNPAEDRLCLQAAFATAQPVDIILYDLNGGMLLRQQVPENVRSYCFELPQSISPGLYLTGIKLSNGQLVTRKIVKM